MPRIIQLSPTQADARGTAKPKQVPAEHYIEPAFVGDIDGARVVGVSKNGFRNLVKKGILPPPKRLGKRCVWDIQALIDAVRAA